MTYLVLFLALILSIVHFLSETISNGIRDVHKSLLSFNAGILITIIILYLFPELTFGLKYFGHYVYLFPLTGFVFFHSAEKYLYQHIKNETKLKKEITLFHEAGFFIDSFLVGLILVLTYFTSIKLALVLFIPLLLKILSSSGALHEIHKQAETIWTKILLSSSVFIGALVGLILEPDKILYFGLLGFVVGVLLYVAIRDLIPEKKEGNLRYFILGVLLTLGLLFVSGFFKIF